MRCRNRRPKPHCPVYTSLSVINNRWYLFAMTQLPTTMETDYLIVGGGLTGTVIASRLAAALPNHAVTLVEAGTNQHSNPVILSPAHAHALRESDHVWKDLSTPQHHLNERSISATTGRTLSGGSAVNVGGWTRCSATDYDDWASKVPGGEHWSYKGQLPYFKRSETWYDPETNPEQHGFQGPIKVHSVKETRSYPLHEQVKNAFLNADIGLELNNDAQAGDPLGVSSWTENWEQGARQPSGLVYGLDGVNVHTNATAAKLLFDKQPDSEADTARGLKAAKGVELMDGSFILARKEVVVCCGAFRTPQLLMLSGIGPKAQLEAFNIPVILENEAVGQNLHDQISLSLFYKLQNGPEKGWAMGSPHFNKPEYGMGSPVDWLAISSVNQENIKRGLALDKASEDHSLLMPGRPHTEMVIVYGPVGTGLPGLRPPFDGSIITAAVLNLLPTSRGSVSITSSSATVSPDIDPQYYATHTDREILRAGVRNLLKVLDSFEDGVLDAELVVDPWEPLTLDSTDDDIDERVKATSSTWYHFGGTAAMGAVVDADLRVMGVRGLRIGDASVLPVPLGGHYQAAMYALAEQAADLIIHDAK
jgi:choline dehydrogenase-like flavoprotein